MWQEQRRFALRTLRDFGFGKKGLDGIIQEEADHCIDTIVEASKKSSNGSVIMEQMFNVYVINVLWQIVASKRFDPDDMETQTMMNMINVRFKKKLSVRAFFPQLRPYLPYSPTDKVTIKLKDYMSKLIEDHERAFGPGDAPNDFIDAYLAEMRKLKPEDRISHSTRHQLVNVCLDFFSAGSETSSTTLTWAVFYMALNPNVQDRCHQEIISVIGNSQPPSQDHKESLPYVQATLLEVQRLSATAPASLPHRATVDIPVLGYTIPKDAKVICNLRRFMRDPKVFAGPEVFRPERFLAPGSTTLKKPEQLVPFGIGKRICMGDSLAQSELFIFFVMMLQRLEIRVDEDKPELEAEKASMGVTNMLHPFHVIIRPRM